MKNLIVIILVLLSVFSYGQKTNYGSYSLVGSKERMVTSFISFDVMMYDFLNDDNANYVGTTLASTLDHSFTIGLTGIFNINPPLESNYLGYLGILLEPTLFPKFPIHITVPCVIGITGSMDSETEQLDPNKYNLLFKGGPRLELNVADGVRLNIGPSLAITKNIVNGEKYNPVYNLDISVKIGQY